MICNFAIMENNFVSDLMIIAKFFSLCIDEIVIICIIVIMQSCYKSVAHTNMINRKCFVSCLAGLSDY